jgi:hypothetical protein
MTFFETSRFQQIIYRSLGNGGSMPNSTMRLTVIGATIS